MISSASRIVLAAVNARHSHTNLAIRYLRNVLADRGYQPLIREYTINMAPLDVVEDLCALKPDVLLLSVYIWNSALVDAMLPDLIRLLAPSPVILGGPEVSFQAQAWLDRHPGLAAVIAGNGEGPLAALAENGFMLSSATAVDARILRGPHVPFHLVPGAWLPGEAAELEHRYLYVETSRGCPYRCSYCLSSRKDQSLEEKPLDQVFAELALVLEAEPLLVKFVDRTFNARPSRAREIWAWLLDWAATHPGKVRGKGPDNPDARRKPRLPEPTRFHFEIQASLIGPEDLSLLARAPKGLFQFEMGVQTSVERTLAAVFRPLDRVRTLEGARQVLALGTIHLHLDMIVGLPGEGMEEIAVTFNELCALEPDHFQMGFLKGLHGTALGDEGPAMGYVFQAAPPYQVLSNPWLSVADLGRLRRVEKLLDSVWSGGIHHDALKAAEGLCGGLFEAFLDLEAHCALNGFDLQIRDPMRIRGLLEGWLSSLRA